MSASASLAKLSDQDRRQVEAWLVEFQQSWDQKRLGAQVRKLPPPGSPLRLPALTELVKIDLERQWQAGHRLRLEAYLKALPELGTAETVPLDLIQAELAARRRAGTPADPAAFARRFPSHAEAVGRLAQAEKETLSPTQAGRSTWESRTATEPGAAPAAPTALPEQFGRYRILKQLGKGGMGAVYLAHDTELDRKVALKVPHFAASDGPHVLERFAREARAAATLTHPNICPVYDVGEWQGTRYVTMAYIEGKPLSDLIRAGKPLPQPSVAALVRKLAQAMHEAHQHGIVHRDLKPSNVMVNKKHEPIIMDFGLARRVQEDARLTKSGSILGTPAYMSPEQVAGDVQAIGPACDIYSLGVILYELLTGRLPFQGPVTAVLGQILTQEPPPPRAVRADLDPALEAICLKAMAKKPADRYGSMRELAAALTTYLKGGGGPAKGRRGQAEGRPAAAVVAAGAAAGAPADEGLATQLLAKLAERMDADAQTIRESQQLAARQHRSGRWPLALGALGLLAAIAVVAYIAILLANKPEGPSGPSTVNVKTEVAVQLALPKELLHDRTIVVYMLDGKEIPREKLTGKVNMEPGDHQLKIRRADGKEEIVNFPVTKKDEGQTIEVPPPNQEPPPPPKQLTVQLALADALNDPSVTSFLLDSGAITKEKLAGPVQLEPGNHVVKIQRKGGRQASRPFVVGPKDHGKTIVLLPTKEEMAVPVGQPVFNLAKVDGPPLDEWVPLFNGKDLDGWGIYPEGTAGWEVQDGVIVGSGPVSTLFSKHGWYRDFHIRIEAMINDGGTSALGVRAKYGAGTPAGAGYRAFINSTGRVGPYRTGALEVHTGGSSYLAHRQDKAPLPPDTWFTYEVIAKGNQLIVKVNDKEVANYLDTNKTLSRGFFLLEHPDKESVIKVKKIEVKELPPLRPFVPPGPTPGWVQLFNRTDLTGWKGFPRETTGWDVKDGVLIGSGPQSRLFSERGDFENFHLRVEAKINHGGQSGLCVRGQYQANPLGYMANINSTSNDSHRTGSLYQYGPGSSWSVERLSDTLIKPDVWFTQEVIAKGHQLIVKINGQETVNAIDQKNMFTRGHLALERFDKNTVVMFRTIEIKELPPSK
jgi:predicted Ser/Thr protein kinase